MTPRVLKGPRRRMLRPMRHWLRKTVTQRVMTKAFLKVAPARSS